MPNVYSEKPNSRVEVLFGPFRLAPAERLLEKAGVAVPLGGRALDILIVLLERPGEVVSKRELIQRVWPDVFVDEGSLRFHIGALRKALGDGKSGARYVTNVPGRGYCFVERVSLLSRPKPASGAGKQIFDEANRLPNRLVRMVGRNEIVQSLCVEVLDQRFVTVVGPGGIGKTTVAVSVAHALLAGFDGEVRFIDLGALSDPRLVASNLASGLGLPVGSDNPIPPLIDYLRDKRMLLVFDSCEHVIEAVAELSENIFMEAPRIHILATSREPLHVEGECIHRLFPLDYPPDDAGLTAEEALEFPAVQLFMERVAATSQDATLSDDDARKVARICRRLDGIALAIELAAGRVAVYGIPGTAALLDDRLGLLWQGRRTAPPRQQTLNATLDWSYHLLPDIERTALRQLAVFAGSFTLDAARAVLTGLNLDTGITVGCLANLVAKSLVSANVAGSSVTYRLLDTTRAYGVEKLQGRGEFGEVARRHAVYYLKLFEGAESDWSARPMAEWLEIYGRQIDNLRAALDWAFSPSGDIVLGISLTIASGLLWFQLSLLDECRRRFDLALSFLERSDADPCQKMRLLGLRSCVVSASTLTDGRNPLAVVLELAEALGDDDHRALALWALWASHSIRGDTPRAIEFANRFRDTAVATADAGYMATADRIFANLAFNAGNLAQSLDYTNKALERQTIPVRRAQLIHHHMDQYVIDGSMQMLILFLQGFPNQASAATQRHYAHAVSTGHALSQINLLRSACLISLYIGDIPTAESYIRKLLELSEGHQLGIAAALGQCFEAMLMNLRGETVAALPILREAIGKYRATRFGVFLPLIIGNLAERLGQAGDVGAGLITIEEAFANAKAIDHHWLVAELLRIRGSLKWLDGAVVAAEHDFLSAANLAHQQGALFWQLRASTGLAGLWKDLRREDEARKMLALVYDRFTEGFDTLDLKSAKRLLIEMG